MSTVNVTLSSFTEKKHFDYTDYVIGYQHPPSTGAERRWTHDTLVKSLSSNYVSSDVELPISRVGSTNYLDLDIKGSFKGGQATTSGLSYILQERDGLFVGLREGNNGVYNKAFYFYANNANLSDLINTDIEYKPSFLTTTEYVSKIVDGNEHGICVQIRDISTTTVKYFWVNVNGTLDASAHTISDVTNITALFGAPHNIQSLVYVKEHNVYIGTRIDYNKLYYFVFNASLTLISNSGVAWLQVDFSNSSHVTFGTWGGSPFTNAGYNHTQRPNIHYTSDSSSIYITQFFSIHSYYASGALIYVHYASASVYTISTNTFSDVYPKPYNHSFDVLANRSMPFFDKSGPGAGPWGSWYNIAQTKFYTIGNTIYEATKEHGWRTHDFRFRIHPILTTKKDAYQAPYSRTGTIPATWSSTPLEFVPFDGALTGKALYNTLFISPTKLYTYAQSRLPSDAVVQNRHAQVTLSNTAATNTVSRIVDNVIVNKLSTPPTSIELFSGQPPNLTNDSRNNSQGHSLITVLDSTGAFRTRYFNQSTRTIFDVDVDTGTTIGTPVILPTDYVTQINNLVTGFTEAVGATIDLTSPNAGRAPNWFLYYIGSGYFLLHYAYYFATAGVRTYLRLVQLGGNTFTVSTPTPILHETLLNLWGTSWNVTPNGRPRQFDMSAGIYTSSTPGEIYIIFNCIGGETPGTNRVSGGVAHVNTNTGTIINNRVINGAETATWHKPQYGIHPFFGPYTSRSHYDLFSKTPIYFRDRRAIIESLQTKMTTIFSELLTGQILNTELIVLTLEGSVGFYVYVSEFPVFIKSKNYKVPSQTINLVTYVGGGNLALVQNKTFYVYAELNSGNINLTFLTTKITDTDTRIYIGEVNTSSVGITTSTFNKCTRIDTLQFGSKIVVNNAPVSTNQFLKIRVANQDKYIQLFN
jgi:hypothetical protein